MSADPTRAPECTCPWTERTDTWARPEGWTYYFDAQEYDPNCPEHGNEPLLEAPAPCPKCGGAASWHGREWSCYGECLGYGSGGVA
jgi:hypothetical protein